MATADFDDRGIIVTCPECGQKNRLLYSRLGEPVQCGRCTGKLSAPAAPIEISRSADFDRLIASASIPVVVDYWAPWCGPCRIVARTAGARPAADIEAFVQQATEKLHHGAHETNGGHGKS